MIGTFRRFWERDGFLSVLLAVLALSLYVALPVAGGPMFGVIGEVVMSLVLLSGLFVVASQHTHLRPAIVFVAGAIALGWLAEIGHHPIATRGALALNLVYLSAMVVVVLERVMRSGRVTVHRINGAIAAYLLLAVLFANGFSLVEHLRPGSFQGLKVTGAWGGFLYFSQTTLFTVGYGDITPVAAGARSLAMLEGLIGQLFPTVLLARLVALEIEDRRSVPRP
jgi:hypothetical protein